MDLIVTIIVGFIVGVIAKFLMPGRDGGGFILTTLLGVAGAFVGSFVAGALGMGGPVGWIGSILGAMLILFVLRMVKKG
ncbi:MAG: GlsB/YeaQ/YmgE family stress response membrane protein [Betaproteobacteria bacterium]|nr:GlsB/YeaQ/YmgE family stress response membrane protein [Betaproteobacteria bacterium]